MKVVMINNIYFESVRPIMYSWPGGKRRGFQGLLAGRVDDSDVLKVSEEYRVRIHKGDDFLVLI